MLLSVNGIILRQCKIAGGKRIISMLTKEYGRLEVSVSGLEVHGKSKSALATKPFTLGRYQLFKNRDFYNYSSGEAVKSYYNLALDFNKYIEASYVLELTWRLLEEEWKCPAIYELLSGFLDSISQNVASSHTLLMAYEIKLLDIMGIAPKMEEGRCRRCESDNPQFFSVPDGGLICGQCRNTYINSHNYDGKDTKETLIYPVNFDIINIVNFFKKKPLSAFEKIVLDKRVAKELQKIIRHYISYHLDVGSLKSDSMLEDIF